MNNFIPPYFLLFLFWGIAHQSVQAQKAPPVDTLVRRMFADTTKMLWIKHFEGRFDDVYAGEMALGYDGKNCRGLLIYRQSKARIRLEGTLVGPVLRLEERDASKQACAFIKGNIDGANLRADWVNYNNSVGAQLSMKEMKPGAEATDFCGSNKWINRYTGTWKSKPIELVLVRLQNGALLGQLWNATDNETLELKGRIDDSTGDYSLETSAIPGRPLVWLEGNLRNLHNTKCSWTSSDGDMRSVELTLKENLSMGCVEFADFLSSYDILFPTTTCAGCNTWMEQQITNWINRTKTGIQSKKLTAIPANRNVLRASIWPEVSCWTDRLFSGYLNYTDTWSGPAQGQSFNLDLQTGKAITFADLFPESFDAKAWLNEYMRKESPKNPRFADDPKFREWLYTDGFPLFTLRRDGVKLSTIFHPIYGQQHLLIPYEVLKPNLIPNSPVAEFVK